MIAGWDVAVDRPNLTSKHREAPHVNAGLFRVSRQTYASYGWSKVNY